MNQINGANSPTNTKSNTAVPVYSYEIVNTYNHDKKAFTQGLVFKDGFLYEGTGEKGRSSLRKVELETGKVLEKRDLAKEYFGEGLTILGDTIYQLTWQEGTAFSYDINDFKLLREFRFNGEGWGLTNDGTNLIMSDGTHILKFIDPENFQVVRKMAVFREDNQPLYLLNELEYINGEIWANIWQSEQTMTSTTQGRMPNIGKPNYIARIDPTSGRVVGWIDLNNISPEDSGDDYENVLNGIAYDEKTGRIFVTGKNWKKLFEIKLKEPS